MSSIGSLAAARRFGGRNLLVRVGDAAAQVIDADQFTSQAPPCRLDDSTLLNPLSRWGWVSDSLLYCLSEQDVGDATYNELYVYDPDSSEIRHVRLLNQGVPLFWYSDLKPEDPAFFGAQILAIEGDWIADPAKLEFSGATRLTAAQREDLGSRLKLQMGDGATRGDVATTYSATIAK